MALTDDSMVMPVSPMYGNGNNGGLFGSNGDSWLGILFLIALCNGGWGGFGGFGGGYGAMMGMDGWGLYPWLNNSEHISDGFRDQQLATQVNGIQNSITSGFGDVQTALCGGFAGTTAAINGAQNAITSQLYNNELASLNRSFAEQTANTQGFNGVNAGIADLRYTEATEACATRAASAQNTNSILNAITGANQAILDKLCQLELDGYKRENDQLRSENSALKNQSFVAAEINQQNETFYNRLKNCPVNAVPVAGNTPLFTCNPGFNNPGCGCGCGA